MVSSVNPPISNLAIGTVPVQRAGIASGMNNVARQMGSGLGVALYGAILSSRCTLLVTDRIQSLQGDQLSESAKGQVIQALESAGLIAGSNGLAGMEQDILFQNASLLDLLP
ncbi:hypothetical protein DMN77_18090 [Paenibacillus sp. 79R4]|nr:hypothetical protein [Paenibacillus sp. 79R4]